MLVVGSMFLVDIRARNRVKEWLSRCFFYEPLRAKEKCPLQGTIPGPDKHVFCCRVKAPNNLHLARNL